MLKSMTAFGRATTTSSVGRFVCEIQSVNRKFLDILITLPKELSRFENEIKKEISSQISRGQVAVKIFAHFDAIAPVSVEPNLPLVRQIAAAWKQIAEELAPLGAPSSSSSSASFIDLNLLAQEEGILIYAENLQNEKLFQEALKDVVDQALQKFLQMKETEGKTLEKDIQSRLQLMSQTLALIEEKAPDASKKYREKLLERLEEVLPGRIENEERILREVALFAERIDIAEELTRFKSHIDQFEKSLRSKENSQGKTLEFLVQELNREINTIGSKSSDITISHSVIAIKSELERIREQIQNVE